MSPQCVSCNNQPNENDSLGGAASEGTVTPVVIGIIVGTVLIFILVLCALFYCVKLENERSLRVKDDDDDERPTPETTGGEASETAGRPVADNNSQDEDDHRVKPAGFGRGRRLSSSITVVAGGEPGGEVMTRAVGGKRKGMGIFGWGGKKGGGNAPAENLPVTAIEMV
ncbi:hypothetical protein VMCG_01936 [Cytospora schulzeri]|uniref:Uncharacterized protein n=1 Tax=Cytospora schulzeri TaxID=448051 RepID=A0A423X448_9PEZI|nr:hypothetical protein VMCG_01936 [Valsa malicola]